MVPTFPGSNPGAPANKLLSDCSNSSSHTEDVALSAFATNECYKSGRGAPVIRRGGVFHFRRVVPILLRPRIGRSELVRSLSTTVVSSARMRADTLYRNSEGLFAAATYMISSDEISRLVKDFYQLTLTIDDHRRLFPEQPWSDEDHRARSDFLDQALVEQRDALRKSDFEKANPAAKVVMARSNLSEADLRPGEYNQIRQAILRASIDIISELRACQDGDFNHEPGTGCSKQPWTRQLIYNLDKLKQAPTFHGRPHPRPPNLNDRSAVRRRATRLPGSIPVSGAHGSFSLTRRND